MFNWYSAPTFGAMLVFWLLAAYILTRSPRGAISLLAVATQVGAAAYFLGQGMQANASTIQEWHAWAPLLQWSAPLTPTLWYWVTVLLLRDQRHPALERYLWRVGYPLGLLFAVGSIVLTASIYLGDWLYQWSAPLVETGEGATYFRFHVPPGPLYPAFLVGALATTLGALLNVLLGWRVQRDAEPRARFGWLCLSAVLFLVGINSLTITIWLAVAAWPVWLSHLIIAAGMVVMAWNLAAYNILVQGKVIRTDFLYFLTALASIALVYGLVFLLVGPSFSFQWLELLMLTLILAILSHALVDVAREVLDRLFFGSDVRHLRANLASVAQDAALNKDVDALLHQVQTDVAQISEEHLIKLTEQALRRLNTPASLARCGLVQRLPRTLVQAQALHGGDGSSDLTPLQQAQALRETLTAAIERLKPSELDQAASTPGALQYLILRQEYLLGLPNKQIMIRHSISEGTFHRNRREASRILAGELGRQEDLLAPQRLGVT